MHKNHLYTVLNCKKTSKIFILLFFAFSFSVSAREINVKTITFRIDDRFTVTSSDKFPFIAENQNTIVALAAPDWKDFSIRKLFASMDTLCFNLNGAELADDKTEYFFQWTKDYITKHYKFPDGKKVITHTFYTNDCAYCLYARYSSIEDEKLIKETINSIWFGTKRSFVYKLLSVYHYASIYWIALAILISLTGIFLKEAKIPLFSSILIVSLIAGFLLLFTTGKHWEIFGSALLIYDLIFVLAYYLGIYITLDTD